MKHRLLACGGLSLVLCLACASGAPDAPSPPADETMAPEPEPDTPDDRAKRGKGGKGGKGARAGRQKDCRTGLLGVLAGLPGLPPGEGGKRQPHPGPVPVHTAPDGKVAASWTARDGVLREGTDEPVCKGGWGDEGCLSLHFGYEAIGVPVYAVRGDWAQIALARGGTALDDDADCSRKGWVELEAPLEVLRLTRLLADGALPYPLDGWDRQVHDAPDGGAHTVGIDGPVHFEIHDTRTERGRTWVDADVLPGRACEGQPEPAERGWIPATDADGRLQVWFFSDC